MTRKMLVASVVTVYQNRHSNNLKDEKKLGWIFRETVGRSMVIDTYISSPTCRNKKPFEYSLEAQCALLENRVLCRYHEMLNVYNSLSQNKI